MNVERWIASCDAGGVAAWKLPASCVLAYASSGGGELEDGVDGEGEPGSGGEFILA